MFKLTEAKKERNSSIELLRIIAMLFVVCSHFVVHGIQLDSNTSVSIVNRIFLTFFILGNLGVDIYVLISGYFLCKQKFSIKRLIKIYLQIYFYSIAIYFIFLGFGKISFDVNSFLKSFFPIIFEVWWFATAYIILYLLSPFLNKLIDSLSKKGYEKLLVILLTIWCIIPTFTTKIPSGNTLTTCIMLYLIGGYIRNYGIAYLEKHKDKIGKYFLVALFLFLSTSVFLNILGLYKPIFALHAAHFYSRESIFTIFLTVMFFYLFIQYNFFNKFINHIASCTFGIYLIHENFLMRKFIWGGGIINRQFMLEHVWISLVISIFVIFSVSILIESLRKKVIEKKTDKCIDKLSKKFNFKKYEEL